MHSHAGAWERVQVYAPQGVRTLFNAHSSNSEIYPRLSVASASSVFLFHSYKINLPYAAIPDKKKQAAYPFTGNRLTVLR